MGSPPLNCPNCGEFWNWNQRDKRREGFSIIKAGIGGAAFGPLGIIAGGLGKKRKYYYCKKCGYEHWY